ncbi:transglycosylase SLT domain-containing protein [Pseudomonas sp. BGI-2]|uniref:transglycosylase SLT domain-containing protein n=1 Tax=Pseudomonas sp. BGI-2 TaxID=2528211 RepID=UPI0010348DBA|nr:transglycosylase SLT domain-containing protein [Pseudomonas sp. BGI-2]TBN49843.1 transglycosylase [Pseudomonas sp. BGI-2]
MTTEYENIKATGTQYDNLIRSAAESEGVRYDLLHKQIYNESSFKSDAKSPTGPLGLAQFTEATGRAYGLMSPEDRLDPVKAVPAMARHMRDLIDKYDGDELAAALAYNQGEGHLGAPQVSAMRSGDFSKLSAEGRGYMAKLLDVAVSPHRDAFKSLTGSVMPQQGALGLTGQPVDKGMTVGELATSQGKPLSGDAELGAWDGTGKASKAALATSVIGTAYRGYAEEGADLGTVVSMMRPVSRMQDNPMTEEDFETLDKLGVQPEYYRQFASAEREEWKNILPTVLDSQDYQQDFDSAGWAAQVTGGLVSAAGDPTSYLPVVGLTGSLGARVVKGAAYGSALAVGSDHLRSRVVGGESHLAASAAGGAILGGALSGAFGKNLVVTHGNAAIEHVGDPFTGPVIRAESRVRAAEAGTLDPTLMPHTEGTPTANVNGVDLQPVPFEDGAVRLANGTILSGSNPLNPVTVARMEQFERAAPGAHMGGFTEIGHTLNRSESADVRGIAGQLFRPPTGTVSGSNGRFAAVASDIAERERGQDNLSYQSLTQLADDAMGSKWYSALPGSRTEAQQLLDRRAIEALEDPTGTARSSLRAEERAYMDAIGAHTERKHDSLSNPAKYGNSNAVSLMDSTRHAGHYFPNVYDRGARALWSERLGGTDALQDAIRESMLRSYAARPATRARVDAHITDLLNAEGVPVTPQAIAQRVHQYANGKAYGITQDNSLTTQAFDINQGQFGGNITENNFLKGRHLFDSDVRVTTPHGEFSVNDLRDFSVGRILQAYDRRVNGDVAVMGSTGKTVGELEAQIKALSDDIKPDERAALDQALKVLTGQARRDTPEGALATVGRALNDTAFTLKSFFMPFQNFTEMAGLVSRGYGHMLGHNIPAYKELVAGKYKMTAEGLNDLHAGLFGRELDGSIVPARADIIERLREQGSSEAVAQSVGSLKWATGAMSRRSPAGYMLPETTNHLIDAGRKGILGDIVRHTLAGGKSPMDNLLISEPSLLRSASITPAQWDGIKDLIRSSMVRDAEGKYSVRDMTAFQSDPRSMHLWRLADRMADEVVIRPHKVSNLDTKAYGVGVKMLMQFKSFLVKSLNERLMRGVNEARMNGRVMDQAYTAALSAMAGGSFYASTAYLKAQMMPTHARTQYLKDALDPNMIAYAALTRGSYLGTPFGLANIVAAPLGFDQAAMVRTSILPEAARKKAPKEKAWLYGLSDLDKPGEILTGALKQVPAAGLISSAAQVGYNLSGLAGTINSPDMAQTYRTGIFNGFRGLIPNDPVSQRLTVEMFERWGIDTTK